jgi:hypothetical protein
MYNPSTWVTEVSPRLAWAIVQDLARLSKTKQRKKERRVNEWRKIRHLILLKRIKE